MSPRSCYKRLYPGRIQHILYALPLHAWPVTDIKDVRGSECNSFLEEGTVQHAHSAVHWREEQFPVYYAKMMLEVEGAMLERCSGELR